MSLPKATWTTKNPTAKQIAWWTRGRNPEKAVRRYRDWHLRDLLKKYEITLEQYEQILKGQAGLCAICARPPIGKTRLSFDHDHRTGKFRGLLCDPCNRAIGYLNDNPERARHLAAYLDRTTAA